MIDKPSFYKTTVTVSVLSEGPLEFDSLRELAQAIEEGNAIGDYEVESEPISDVEAARLAVQQGCDSELLGLDAEGNRTEA